MMATPLLDARTRDDVAAQLVELIRARLPSWKPETGDPGMAMAEIFARYMEIVIERLNRVPDKNFLAFLDMIGVSLQPPRAARAPVQFLLAQGAKTQAVVPEGTPLSTAGADPLMFETDRALTVTPCRLVRSVALDPASDRHATQDWPAPPAGVAEPFPCFTGPDLIPHALFLKHDALLGSISAASVEVTFTVAQGQPWEDLCRTLAWSLRAGDTDAPLAPSVTRTGNTVKVALSVALAAATTQTTVDDQPGFWLQAATTQALAGAVLPDVSKIELRSVSLSALRPNAGFSNNAQVDVGGSGFFCFGDRPKVGDALLFSASDPLARAGARVTVTVNVAFPSNATGTPAKVRLAWEYWAGEKAGWTQLATTQYDPAAALPGTAIETTSAVAFTDPSAALTKAGQWGIAFNCPEIGESKVNGILGRWIRIRILEGGYGGEATLTKRIDNPASLADWAYTPPSFRPPFLTRLELSYAYAAPVLPERISAWNSFAFQTTVPAAGVALASFVPFRAPAAGDPALYLGFDRKFGNVPLKLYLAVIEQPDAPQGPVVTWEYWDGAGWSNLGAADETRNLTQPGLVEFIGPADFQESSPFGGKSLFWMRVRLDEGQADKALFALAGIHLNAVWAVNAQSLRNELIGSSTGRPGQTFKLAKSPVLEGEAIEVREPGPPSEAELAALVFSLQGEPLRLVRDATGKVTETWVRWVPVEHFTLSGADSRHYLVERATGQLRFGDGQRGMIPPPGRDNVRAASYRAGGGRKGNVEAGTITVIKRAVPQIDGATNPYPAGGGSEQETVDEVKVRGPLTLKHRDRAVSYEDYEWLAREASAQVARALCIPVHSGLAENDTDLAGRITLLLVPVSDEAKPQPSPGLVRAVKDALDARRLPTVAFTIKGPKYVEVAATATVVPRNFDEADLVRRRVADELAAFLHPLTGGPEKQGWDFGRDVYVSEVAAVIEAVEGVDHVKALSISGSIGGSDRTQDGGRRVETLQEEGELVAAGKLSILMSGT
jgi:baseplate J-like protein